MIYFLDANIISYLLKGNTSVLKKLEELAEDDNQFEIPSIVYYEIKRGLLASGAATKLTRFLNFAKEIGIVDLKNSTLDIAAQIYADLKKSGEIIEDDDIFIGATALENNAILVTNNKRHLGRIKDLKIEVWN
ncbi:type II toxin-antitoxin system VapC family toxin [Treponema sp.]|uniref:type II toxin-antitoxin system VapC family toxin n=1 Tax=Treponema sp. TaxID=166 RepID=UPI002600F551|nr:type II toxin-antitoxin system VapC family toxin [Treponema sp.]MBR4323715.1 type II toxin-antitoxin system VapC family toxin [Treponema sp.]